jgi:BTB/POZ domain
MQSSAQGKTYFDLDGDEELRQSNSNDGPTLTWRGDPKVTLSDWTIMIVTNELQTCTYNVHKSVLCFGSRQSKFFARTMLNNSPKRSRKQGYSTTAPCTKVELNQRDADNFPIVLDYIYAPNNSMSSAGTVITAASTLTSPSLLPSSTDDTDCSHSNAGVEDINTANAVSLRFLARQFEVDSLTIAVNRFIQKDLSFRTGPTYLLRAYEYKDDRLLESAQRLCADNFEQLDMRALLKLPINLFRIMVKSLESYEEDNQSLSLYLSNVVCKYFEKHPKSLCAELLVELTDPLCMPYITSEASIGITALVKELDANDSALYWSSLVSLSRRCAKAVVQEYGWNDFSVNAAVDEYLGNGLHPQHQSETVSRVDNLLFATSFAAALEQAQDDYEDILMEQQRLEATVDMLRQTIESLEKTHQMKDDYMAKQQRIVEDAKKQIVSLKQQIGQVKRQQLKRPPAPTHSMNLAPLEKASPIHECRNRQTRVVSANLPPASPIKELVSPSQVGMSVHVNKRRAKELMTRDEMRTRSLLV